MIKVGGMPIMSTVSRSWYPVTLQLLQRRAKMRITWEVEDGYAGKSRPQSTQVDDDELLRCDTVEEALEVIDECVHTDFENTISWCFNGYDSMKSELEELFQNKESWNE